MLCLAHVDSKVLSIQADTPVFAVIWQGGMQSPSMVERSLTRLKRTHQCLILIYVLNGLIL